MFSSAVIDIAAGGFHALALTESGQVFGWGKKSKAQLGSKHRAGDAKFVTRATEIKIEAKVTKVLCGSLYSIAQVASESQMDVSN